MTLCIKTKAQCNCQPDEGVFCPDYKPDWYVQCLMDAITELRASVNRPEGGAAKNDIRCPVCGWVCHEPEREES